jgi:hypothetical protein
VNISRSDDHGIFKSLRLHGGQDECFRFEGCATNGTMGAICLQGGKGWAPVPQGANLLVYRNGSATGAFVDTTTGKADAGPAEGVCCNGVTDAVLSISKLACSPA